MAGREFSGVAHSTAGLYENSSVLLVPVAASLEALAAVKKMYLGVGAEGVVITDADTHDEMIAYTSQLAHIVSGAYVKNPLSARHKGFSAGSFLDMTRVARLNEDMWTELFLDDADYLTTELDELIVHLREYADAIRAHDAQALRALLRDGREKKASAGGN